MIMVQNSKTQKIILDGNGSYLGMEKGCFVVKDSKGNSERYPLFEKEIGEVVLKSGNMVSTGALASLGFWDVDVMIMTSRGRPVAILKGLDDDSHVSTRVAQYEALKDGRGLEIAKQFVLGKLEGQNQVLKKYGLRQFDFKKIERVKKLETEDLTQLRKKLLTYESHASRAYFQRIFSLFPDSVRPEGRRTFKAYDGINNLFNLGYELLSWKVQKALVNAKLEPYLGFVHSEQYGKPSLVCDMMEIYRFIVDDYLIQHYRKITKNRFVTKKEPLTRKKVGKREYLNNFDSKKLMYGLNRLFEAEVQIPRIRHGKKQKLETLINEEALLFARRLRIKNALWKPRIIKLLRLRKCLKIGIVD
jgi:CRISPR-associated protein Cas1